MIYLTGDCHGDFTRLYKYPVEEWNGGKIHKIRDSVLHLMRGEIFDIDNKKFLHLEKPNHMTYKMEY